MCYWSASWANVRGTKVQYFTRGSWNINWIFFVEICFNCCLISLLNEISVPLKRFRIKLSNKNGTVSTPLLCSQENQSIYPKHICKFPTLFISICLTFRKLVEYTFAGRLHSNILLIYSTRKASANPFTEGSFESAAQFPMSVLFQTFQYEMY